jgi:DNA (cytosine-5)-methyltransferase 1
MKKLAIIDLFCGAGGTTTGVERAKVLGKRAAKVIACVNHDPIAIQSHAQNHKGVLHFTEDIRTLNLSRIIRLVEKYRKEGYLIGIWASLECTNFSNAKGGGKKDADSRTLAEHLHRYIDALKADYIFIENVIEFMSWGRLNKHGKPVSKDKGKSYLKWINDICRRDYSHGFDIINSADFGAHTSRKRYFGIFAKSGLPTVFPQATHSKNPAPNLKKWKPVKELLDLEDEGKSIFDREKPLKEKTLVRIYDGLIKQIAGGKEEYTKKYYTRLHSAKYLCIHKGAKEFFSQKNHSEIIPTKFLSKYYGSAGQNQSVEKPCDTIPTKDRFSKITVKQFISNPGWFGNSADTEQPCLTIVARQDKAPLYLINCDQVTAKFSIPVFDTDSETMKRIKEFMALYGIVDIKMRMLKVNELKKIQGFPEDYILKGSQKHQKKFIGNSVVPLVAQRIIEEIVIAASEYLYSLAA